MSLGRLPAESVARIKGKSSHIKRSRLKVFSLQIIKKKNPPQVWEVHARRTRVFKLSRPPLATVSSRLGFS